LLGKAGCPAASLSFMNAFGSGPNKLVGKAPDCPRFLDGAIARINELEPDLLVLASCNGCDYMVDPRGDVITHAAWAEGLRQTLARIRSPSTEVVVLGDIPRWRGPLDCLATHPRDVQACSKPVGPVTAATYNDVEQGVADAAGIRFIDVTPWFCDDVCSPVVGKLVVYTNEYHVTSTYARSLSRALEATLWPTAE
jgi:hypothetical protein